MPSSIPKTSPAPLPKPLRAPSPLRASALGPALYFLLLAAALISPFASSRLTRSAFNDLSNHVSGIADAKNALAEGQFPIRIAPTQNNAFRYAIFQFYGNFPYTAGALVCLATGLDPYTAWKIVVLLSLAAGGLYTHRCALAFTRRLYPSLIAGTLFIASPYMLADLHARFAFVELVSFNLLPVVLFYTWKSFVSPTLSNLPKAALAWALLALSHNITLLYAVFTIALFLLTCLRFDRRSALRLARVLAAGLFAILLVLWYLAPQLQLLPYLNLNFTGHHTDSPFDYAFLTQLDILLWPFLKTPPRSSTPNLGLQIGWPILLASLLALLTLARPALTRRRTFTLRFLALLALSFFIAWSPVDFWSRLPKTFGYIQFPYRMLMFVALWGALASASALAACFRKPLGYPALLLALALAGLASSSYLLEQRPLPDSALKALVDRPNMCTAGAGDVYFIAPAANTNPAWQLRSSSPVAYFNGSWQVIFNEGTEYTLSAPQPLKLVLPAYFYPGLQNVYLDDQPVPSGMIDRFLALQVPPGQHRIRLNFVGLSWANWLSLLASLALLASALLSLLRSNRRLTSLLPNSTTLASSAAALPAFAAVLLGLMTPHLTDLAHRLTTPPVRFTLSASSQLDENHKPDFAFDNDHATEWAARDSSPATLTLSLDKPASLQQVTLFARQTWIYEGWHHVEIESFLNDKSVARSQFDFPNAPIRPVQTLHLPDAKADRILFRFSEPVLHSPDLIPVNPNQPRPGYTEIRLRWH